MPAKILVIIPARGGSKGIPRKNLRSLNGKPLISYSIEAALNSIHKPDVYVSTDDEEISSISEKFGSKVIRRDSEYADDKTTLDPVIYHAYKEACKQNQKQYDLIVTLQPTSPLLKTKSLDLAISKLLKTEALDTIISACDDTHLTWVNHSGKFLPNYVQRVNRQEMTPVYKETGGFLITRDRVITHDNRIGANVELHLLEKGERIDIDTFEDWTLCEYYLRQRRILFVVSGNQRIGLGHVYNTLLIANDILNHQVEFLVDKESELAYDNIARKNYIVHMQAEDNIVLDILRLEPNVVINDRLDTTDRYIESLRNAGIRTINFEDLGEGARSADLVINAIYPEREVLPKHYFGHKYFVLRDEFILTEPAVPKKVVQKVLLTFGGVDPNNYTLKVLRSIYQYCQTKSIDISVIAGFGYTKYESLNDFNGIRVLRDVKNIAEYMRESDLAFISAGRTAYEIASLHVPAIVLAQNEREMTHFAASSEYGFVNLGLGTELSEEDILTAFVSLVENYAAREYMSHLMAETDLSNGRKRVMRLINNILESI